MKKRVLFLLAVVMLTVSSFAQVYQRLPAFGYDMDRILNKKGLSFPKGSAPTLNGSDSTYPAIMYILGDSTKVRFYSPETKSWHIIGSSSGVGDTSDITNFYQKVRSLFSGIDPVIYSNGNISLDTSSGKIRSELYLDTKYPRFTSSYSNPSWISDLAWSKISGKPTTLSGYGITNGVDSMRRVGLNWQIQRNGSWITVGTDSVGSGGGGAAWGGITGTLSDQTDLLTALNLRLLKTDTAAMLANYIDGAGTGAAGRLALFNGTGSIYGSSKFNFSDATYPTLSIIGSDPLIYIGPSATLTNNPAFGSGAGAAIYGGATYKSINLYDQISGGIQMARFYNSGGTIYNNLNGLIISNTLSSPSNYQGSFTIQRTVPYAVTGLNYHGFTDQTDFRVGTNAFNSFGTFVTIGNNRTYQDHFAGFQAVWYKDSTNRLGKIYDFVSAVSEMRAGTIDTVYRFKVFEMTKTGGTVVRQYGIQIDNLTAATTNIGAWIYNNVGIGPTAHTPTERLVVDGNILTTGTIKTGDPGSGAQPWHLGGAVSSSGLTLITNQYIEVKINGTLYKFALVQAP